MMVLLGVDPNLVRPGWTPLVILVLLGIVLFFLGRSMLKQFGKIDVPADHEAPAGVSADAASEASSADERTLTEPSNAATIPDLRRPAGAAGDDTPSDSAPDRG